MESKWKGNVKMSKQDNYNTPLNAWMDILQFIDNKNEKIWCPFYNDGSCKTLLNSIDYNNVIHENKDFFTYDIANCIIIDNPPYSMKEKIIHKLFENKKEFCLLLPLDTIERKYFKKYSDNFQLIIPNIRYKFKSENSNPPFKTCWFCWNMENVLKTNSKLIFL